MIPQPFDLPLPPPCGKSAFALRLYPSYSPRQACYLMNKMIDRRALRPLLEAMGCTRHCRRLSPEAQLLLLATHRKEQKTM